MLQTLVQSIASKERNVEETAQRRYNALLLGEENSSEAELTKLMHALGKTAADLADDHRAAEEWRRLRGVIAAGNGLDQKREAATRAIEGHLQEKARVEEELREKHRKLATASYDLEQQHIFAERAVQELNALCLQRADLFGEQAEATAADVT